MQKHLCRSARVRRAPRYRKSLRAAGLLRTDLPAALRAARLRVRQARLRSSQEREPILCAYRRPLRLSRRTETRSQDRVQFTLGQYLKASFVRSCPSICYTAPTIVGFSLCPARSTSGDGAHIKEEPPA